MAARLLEIPKQLPGHIPGVSTQIATGATDCLYETTVDHSLEIDE